MATVEGGLVWFRGGFTVGTLFLDRWTCIWQYSPLRTEPSKSYWVYSKSYWIYPRIPWWYLGQQYINRKGSFLLLLFLYYHVFPCPLRHFTKWHWGPWKAAARDAAEAQGVAEVPPSTVRGSRSPLCRAYSSESQEKSGGQGQGRGWEVEGYRGRGSTSSDSGIRC